MTRTLESESQSSLQALCLGYLDEIRESADRFRQLGDKYDTALKDAAEARGSLHYTQSVLAKRDEEIKSLKSELDEAGDIISTYHDALLTALQIGKADLCLDCHGEGVVAVAVEHQASNGSFVQPTSIEPGTCERCRGIGREW